MGKGRATLRQSVAKVVASASGLCGESGGEFGAARRSAPRPRIRRSLGATRVSPDLGRMSNKQQSVARSAGPTRPRHRGTEERSQSGDWCLIEHEWTEQKRATIMTEHETRPFISIPIPQTGRPPELRDAGRRTANEGRGHGDRVERTRPAAQQYVDAHRYAGLSGSH